MKARAAAVVALLCLAAGSVASAAGASTYRGDGFGRGGGYVGTDPRISYGSVKAPRYWVMSATPDPKFWGPLAKPDPRIWGPAASPSLMLRLGSTKAPRFWRPMIRWPRITFTLVRFHLGAGAVQHV